MNLGALFVISSNLGEKKTKIKLVETFQTERRRISYKKEWLCGV